MTNFISLNHLPINPISQKQVTNNTTVAKRVVLLILLLSSVDNQICSSSNNRPVWPGANVQSGRVLPSSLAGCYRPNKTPTIKTTINQPCNEDISLQNSSSEAISSPSAIHNAVVLTNIPNITSCLSHLSKVL